MVPDEERQGVRPPYVRQEWLLSASAQIDSQAQRSASVAWAGEEKSIGPLGAVSRGRNSVTKEVLLPKKHQVSGLPGLRVYSHFREQNPGVSIQYSPGFLNKIRISLG